MAECESCRQYEDRDPLEHSVEALLGRFSVSIRTRRDDFDIIPLIHT